MTVVLCYSSANVRVLAARCLQGDEAAMHALVDRYRGLVMSLCYRMLGHHQDAEDAAQETFVRALRALGNWDVSRDFEPWLLAIAGNRCRTALSSRKRRPATHPLLQEQPSDGDFDEGAARQLAEEVQLALAQLRQEYRQAFLLFHEHQLNYQEIARTMRCPLGTVKTWVHRARREMMVFLRNRGVVEETRHALPGV